MKSKAAGRDLPWPLSLAGQLKAPRTGGKFCVCQCFIGSLACDLAPWVFWDLGWASLQCRKTLQEMLSSAPGREPARRDLSSTQVDWLTAFRLNHCLILSGWCAERGHVSESSVFLWPFLALGVPAARNILPSVSDWSLQSSVNPRQASRLSSTRPYSSSPPPCSPPLLSLTLAPTGSKECFGPSPPGQSSVTPALCWGLRDNRG